MSIFERVQPYPPDPIFGLEAQFRDDPRPKKVNLIVGTYRCPDLKLRTMRSVVEAEKLLIRGEENKAYLPMGGQRAFLERVQQLVFGDMMYHALQKKLTAIQSLGGTGALHLGGRFLKHVVSDRLYLPSPTWPNHREVFESCGMTIEHYPYYNTGESEVDYESMLKTFSRLPKKSIIILHACCHNPTGYDLDRSQWRELSLLLLRKGLIPFFDFAYQGFGHGLRNDAWAVRHFAEQGHEMLVATSCSKSFGLYGERVGCLSILSNDSRLCQNVEDSIKKIVRGSYSNPPLHGASIVSTILGNDRLKKMWMEEMSQMHLHIKEMRAMLADALISQRGGDKFQILRNGVGLFSMLGLEGGQVEKLREEYGIYCTENSRLNLTGLSRENIAYVIEAIMKTDR